MVICINPFLSLSLVDAIELKCLIYRSEYRAVKDESRLALHLAVRKTSILSNEKLLQSHAFKREKKIMGEDIHRAKGQWGSNQGPSNFTGWLIRPSLNILLVRGIVHCAILAHVKVVVI